MKAIVLILAILASTFERTTSLMPRSTPEEEGMSEAKLKKIDDLIIAAMEKKDIPGAVVGIVRNSKLVYSKAYGFKAIEPAEIPMTEDTVFDLASMSKPIGTGFSMMHLLGEGKFRLSDKVSLYFPDFIPWTDPQTQEKTEITILNLLTHTSGLKSYVSPQTVIDKMGRDTPEALMEYISTMDRDYKPGTTFQYSCLNFITLQNILQKITGERLEDFAKKNVFDALGLESTTYNPKQKMSKEYIERIAPTEKQPDGSILKGEVHDPLARILNKGNSGNAGVFSSLEDLAVVASAVMNNGKFQTKRLIGKLALEAMTQVPEQLALFGRSLSWDNYSTYSSNNGEVFTRKRTVGHTGYTGTSISIDPVSKIAVIILANRVHPTDTGSCVRLTALVANTVASAILE